MWNKHLNSFSLCGLKARSGKLVDNALEHKIMQPALVNISAFTLATEVTWMILKIDDIVESRWLLNLDILLIILFVVY